MVGHGGHARQRPDHQCLDAQEAQQQRQHAPGRAQDHAVGHRSLRCRPAHQQRRSRETTGTGQDKTGSKKVVAFKKAIIAAGSQAVRLPFMPDDPRVVDSTGALALQGVPQKMLIVGGGIIGLEMGTVYSTLGARLDVVEMMDGLMQGADRDLVKVWEKMNKHRFDNILLKTKTVGAQATPEGIQVQFEGLDGTKSEGTYDLVLQAVGRTPNGKKIA
ncbi:MAG: FAD-dependent oxidoreductase, partial [Burkholderiales bacterium]|nr:FAD-dependent oxidoreductase [Burkholderiales bacterium]